MKLFRFSAVALVLVFAAAACSGEKVKPEGEEAKSALTPEELEARKAAEYQKKQSAFTDSVLKNASSAAEIAKKNGADVTVGSLPMRDSLVKYVAASPQCVAAGREIDPYLAGTVSFYVHMSVVGSDVVRVQSSEWTSPAGNVVDKCFTEAATKWKFPMGMAKQGKYILQVQFKPQDKAAQATIDVSKAKADSAAAKATKGAAAKKP